MWNGENKVTARCIIAKVKHANIMTATLKSTVRPPFSGLPSARYLLWCTASKPSNDS